MSDLPPAPRDRCTQAYSVNNRGQAVGADFICGGNNVNAMLWQDGQAYNLNTLIAPSRLHLTEAFFISPRGQIACIGTLPNGDSRVVLVTRSRGSASHALARRNANRTVSNPNPVATPDVRANGPGDTWPKWWISQRFGPTLP